VIEPRQSDSRFVVARFVGKQKTTVGLLERSGLSCFAVRPDDGSAEKMEERRTAAISSCGPLLARTLATIQRWCPAAHVPKPIPDLSAARYAVVDDQEACGFKVFMFGHAIAQSGWHRPAGGHSGFFPGWDQVMRSAFGVEVGAGARAFDRNQQSAILSVAERFVDECLASAVGDHHELRLDFASDRESTGRCLAQADPIASTIAVHDRWHVLEFDGGHATLEFDGDAWVAHYSSTVEGPLYDCPDNHFATCSTTYGYRDLTWRLNSISTDGDGELTIIDQALDDKKAPTCRRVVPFRAVLVRP